MAQRPHIYVRRFVTAEPGESPNAYFPAITVEIRAFWPDLERDKVAAILTDAYEEAMVKLEAAPTLPEGVVARIDVTQEGVRVNLREGMAATEFAEMLRLIADAYETGDIRRTE